MQLGFPVGMPVSFVKKTGAGRWGAAVAVGLSLVLASSARAQCSSNAECDDGIACTVDTCLPPLFLGQPRTCQHVSDCGDDIYCNGQEACCTAPGGCDTTPFGQCIQGVPVVCIPGTFCDPFIDLCIQCNDNGDCDDGNDCTDDVCDVNFDCQNTPLTVGAACNDGDLCTTNDVCDGGAVPTCAGTLTECDDVLCQTGFCNATTGACGYTNFVNGTGCRPGDLCFPGGECQAGTCVGVPARGCVDIYFETQSTPATVGDIIEVDLLAQYNATPECTPPPSDCPAGTHPVSSVEAVFTWDPNVLELVDPGSGVPNPEDPCSVGASCSGNCVPSCYDCGQTARQYDWSSSGFPQDCATDGINAPCPSHPANDGDATYLSFVAIGCDHDSDPGTPLIPAPPACVAGTFPFHVTTLKFLAIGATAGASPDTAITIEDCILQSRSKVLSSSAGDDVRGTLGTPVTVEVQCVNDSHCSTGAICTGGICQNCLPPVVEVEGSRYIAVTPPDGPPEVAILVTGTDPGISCKLGYAGLDGRVNPDLDPSVNPNNAYDAPGAAGWGTVHIRGEGIIGDGTYDVRLDCDRSNPGTSLSDSVTVTMWQKGDADDRFGGGVDILDATLILDGFRGLFLSTRDCASDADCVGLGKEYCDLAANKCMWTTLENTDLKGALVFCRPDRGIDIGDVTVSLNFFRGIPDVCDSQCP